MASKILFPNEIILETESFKVAQDWEVPIPGFFIVSTKRKILSIAEMTEKEAEEFIKIVRHVRQAMKDSLNIKEVYLFQNEDSKHGFHLWMFPRYDWMEQFGKKIESVKPIMLYAEKNMISENKIEEVKDAVRKISHVIKDDFKDLLKHSEKVAQKLWSSKEDDIWDTV
ncbi:MAG: HIT domain-containing protein [Nanoarchaeota archaeon]